jgi:hypothetical protein
LVRAPAVIVSGMIAATHWLGWSSDWSPPKEQARDWLGEALIEPQTGPQIM